MTDPVCTRESFRPYPTEPVGAHKRPTGPRGVGRLTPCATPTRHNCRCSTHLVGHWPRGPPHLPVPAGSAVRLQPPGGLALQYGRSTVAPRPHTISLAQFGPLVQRRTPAPGGGCVASPLDLPG